ncbi:MAG: MFS transporter [Halanaerobiales bacterium]
MVLKKKKKIILTLIIYLSYVMMGISKNIIGPVLPTIIENYKITLTLAGTLFTLLSLGRLFSVSTSSGLLDSIGRKRILLSGLIFLFVGHFGYALSFSWWLHLVSIMILGIGIGLMGPSCNALIADIYQEKRGQALNLLHMCFSIGALIGPIIAGSYLTLNINWRWIYITAGGITFLLFLLISSYEFPTANKYERFKVNKLKKIIISSKNRWKKILQSPILILLGLIMFIYIGVGNGFVGWINKYLEDTKAFSVLSASGVLAIYNLGIIGGRLVCSFISDNLGYKKTILFCALGSLLFINVAVLSNSFLIILAGFGLTGFFLAGLNPTAIAYGTKLFPDMTGTVSGGLTTLAVLGGTVIPLLMGVISDYFGLQGGMMTTIVFAVILLIMAGFLKDDKQLNN